MRVLGRYPAGDTHRVGDRCAQKPPHPVIPRTLLFFRAQLPRVIPSQRTFVIPSEARNLCRYCHIPASQRRVRTRDARLPAPDEERSLAAHSRAVASGMTGGGADVPWHRRLEWVRAPTLSRTG
ncbi:MAG: hypothetical protein KatS3mg059_1651 [Thermomicrobiales bacterium]|nr:MAG: hypothetical protein KatS3mg059_1651 [Thermomicrobiales bacterium]